MTDVEFIPLLASKHMKALLNDELVRFYIDSYGIEAMGDELGYQLKLDVFRDLCAREHMAMPTDITDDVAENYMYFIEDNSPKSYAGICNLIKKAN